LDASGGFVSERIFFPKVLPLQPAYSGEVLNKKRASVASHFKNEQKSTSMKSIKGRAPPNGQHSNRRPVTPIVFKIRKH
jgi:hypothetical protein